MVQGLQRSNRFIIALALAVSSVGSLMISPITNAAPGYDDDYQTVSSVQTGGNNYGGRSCNSTDISSTWQKYITDSSTWYNPSDASDPSSWHSQAKASLETALQSGRWGVSQYVETGGDGYLQAVQVVWTEDDSLSLNWPNDSGVYGYSQGTNDFHYAYINCRNIAYGSGGSDPIFSSYGSGNTSVAISIDKPFSLIPTIAGGSVANYYIRTDNPNCPSGYPNCVPNVMPITGNVQCETMNTVTSVRVIVPDGVDGDATTVSDSIGGVDYSFYLAGKDTPYRLIVTCDGLPYYSPTVNANFYQSKNWVCAEVGGYNMNGCAAS